MLRLVLTLILILNIASLSLSAKGKKTIKSYNQGAYTIYDFSKETHNLSLAPFVNSKKNNRINFFNIQFIGLGADVVKTKLVDPGIVENPSLKFSQTEELVSDSSVSHKIRLDKNITSSIAYLNLETYVEKEGLLELKESIPVRLNIAPIVSGYACIAVVECAHFVFPDIDFYDYVGYVCAPGAAVDGYVDYHYCADSES